MPNDIKVANPGPEELPAMKEWWSTPTTLAINGFALTTMCAGLAVGGWIGAGPMLAMAIAFGGTAQFVGGIIDLRKGVLFGGSAFMGYGAFWWALFFLDVVMPATGFPKATPTDMAAFWFVWLLYTTMFLIVARKVPGVGKALATLFFLLWVAFLLLFVRDLGLTGPGFKTMAGIEIFITGLLAWYIGMGTVVNTVAGRKMLPLG